MYLSLIFLFVLLYYNMWVGLSDLYDKKLTVLKREIVFTIDIFRTTIYSTNSWKILSIATLSYSLLWISYTLQVIDKDPEII